MILLKSFNGSLKDYFIKPLTRIISMSLVAFDLMKIALLKTPFLFLILTKTSILPTSPLDKGGLLFTAVRQLHETPVLISIAQYLRKGNRLKFQMFVSPLWYQNQ